MKEESKWKDFKHRMKIFAWYIFTEPLRQIKDFLVLILDGFAALNRTVTWIYISSILMIVALFIGKKLYAGLLLIVLLICFLFWEWQSGTFMYRYRQHIKKKINKEVEKNGYGEQYRNEK